MSKQATYTKQFSDRLVAYDWMKMKNACAGNRRDLFVLVDGPSDNFIVCDIRTAIDLEMPYEWAA